MPIVKGLRTAKLYDAKFNMLGQNPTGSIFDIGPSSLSLGGATSLNGDNSIGERNLLIDLTKDTTEGSPSAPCIRLQHPTFWRFKWVVKPGQRRIAVRVKQVKTYTNQRPKLIVKANSNVGLTVDLEAVAPESVDWTVIGPIIFTATGTDVVWVEVHHRLYIENAPLFIDHIVAT